MYQQDASWMITTGKLLLVTLFLVAGTLNLMPARVKDHVVRPA